MATDVDFVAHSPCASPHNQDCRPSSSSSPVSPPSSASSSVMEFKHVRQVTVAKEDTHDIAFDESPHDVTFDDSPGYNSLRESLLERFTSSVEHSVLRNEEQDRQATARRWKLAQSLNLRKNPILLYSGSLDTLSQDSIGSRQRFPAGSKRRVLRRRKGRQYSDLSVKDEASRSVFPHNREDIQMKGGVNISFEGLPKLASRPVLPSIEHCTTSIVKHPGSETTTFVLGPAQTSSCKVDRLSSLSSDDSALPSLVATSNRQQLGSNSDSMISTSEDSTFQSSPRESYIIRSRKLSQELSIFAPSPSCLPKCSNRTLSRYLVMQEDTLTKQSDNSMRAANEWQARSSSPPAQKTVTTVSLIRRSTEVKRSLSPISQAHAMGTRQMRPTKKLSYNLRPLAICKDESGEPEMRLSDTGRPHASEAGSVGQLLTILPQVTKKQRITRHLPSCPVSSNKDGRGMSCTCLEARVKKERKHEKSRKAQENTTLYGGFSSAFIRIPTGLFDEALGPL